MNCGTKPITFRGKKTCDTAWEFGKFYFNDVVLRRNFTFGFCSDQNFQEWKAKQQMYDQKSLSLLIHMVLKILIPRVLYRANSLESGHCKWVSAVKGEKKAQAIVEYRQKNGSLLTKLKTSKELAPLFLKKAFSLIKVLFVNYHFLRNLSNCPLCVLELWLATTCYLT